MRVEGRWENGEMKDWREITNIFRSITCWAIRGRDVG